MLQQLRKQGEPPGNLAICSSLVGRTFLGVNPGVSVDHFNDKISTIRRALRVETMTANTE